MNKHRGYRLLMTVLVLLLVLGLAVLFHGASTYVKPRAPFGGPPAYLRNTTLATWFL